MSDDWSMMTNLLIFGWLNRNNMSSILLHILWKIITFKFFSKSELIYLFFPFIFFRYFEFKRLWIDHGFIKLKMYHVWRMRFSLLLPWGRRRECNFKKLIFAHSCFCLDKDDGLKVVCTFVFVYQRPKH